MHPFSTPTRLPRWTPAPAALLLAQIFPIIPDILGRRALPAGRLARLGATRDFHHGLPGERIIRYARMAGKTQTPTLMVAGQHDKQVSPDRVRELYADLAAPQKLFVDLACSSHNAMWEKNRLLLFRASLEWLTRGSVNGTKDGTVRLGY